VLAKKDPKTNEVLEEWSQATQVDFDPTITDGSKPVGCKDLVYPQWDKAWNGI